MEITSPIPGLDNFKLVTDTNGTARKVWFSQSSKFTHIARPGAQHKDIAGLGIEFIVRAKDMDDAEDIMSDVWS